MGLIHLEVQGEPEDVFPQRMFVYSYRTYDKYQKQIASCAILTDPDPDWRPDHWEIGLRARV